jgi:hypothetical protein
MSTSTQYAPQPDLDRLLKQNGVSKTVYALVTPETEAAKRAALGYGGADAEQHFFALFRDAWTGKQEALHQQFFATWHDWARPMVKFDVADFAYAYPTAGASEALYHLVADYGNSARLSRLPPTLHIFAGEYEGYKAYAEACGIAVREHQRSAWQAVAEAMVAHDLFFISQPSAIDGNLWPEFNPFLRALTNASPPRRAVVDVTYVGATGPLPQHRLDLTLPSVQAIVLSLSKPFGTYYDRIGGVFCRSENLGLFGNKWFKNITSLTFGIHLMQTHDVFAFATRHEALQAQCCTAAAERLGLALAPADIFILATGTATAATPAGLAAYLARPTGSPTLRLCLTPAMAQALGTATNQTGSQT